MKKLKWLIVIVMMAMFFIPVGCGNFGMQLPHERVQVALVKTVARQIGCEVAKLDPRIDRSLRNIYMLAKTGKLTEDGLAQINELIGQALPGRPTLAADLTDLLSLAGVEFGPAGKAIGLDHVPPGVFEAVETGYISGFELCGP